MQATKFLQNRNPMVQPFTIHKRAIVVVCFVLAYSGTIAAKSLFGDFCSSFYELNINKNVVENEDTDHLSITNPTANPIPESPGTCLGGSMTADGMPSGGTSPYTHSWIITGGSATGIDLLNADQQIVTIDASNPLATTGRVELTYVVTDDLDLSSDSIMIEIEIGDCQPSISDPCSCLNNATNFNNGQFSEIVEVSAPSGQTWTVVSVNGLYSINSPNPPIPPTSIGLGTTLVENPANSGAYILEGIHVDALGYIITVENELGQQLTIENTCYYPTPEITGLNGPVCLYTTPIPLTYDAGGVDGTASFSINGIPSTVFDPMVWGIGIHIVDLTFDAGTATSFDPNDPGCEQYTFQTVNVYSTPEALACNQGLQVSLNENCEALITADMYLEGSYLCYDDYTVAITHNQAPVPNPPSSANIGQLLTVTVTHLPSGNTCWGTLELEDKLPPEVFCSNSTIQCYDDPASVPPPTFLDNCDPNPSLSMVNEFIDDSDPCNGVTITRSWLTWDMYNNISDTCTQTITIAPPPLPDMPEDTVWTCTDYALYPNLTDATALTGNLATTGAGIPENIDGYYCQYGYTFSDDTISGCGNTIQIIRTWLVLNWCSGQIVYEDINGDDNIQVIEIIDDVGPVITMNPITLNANISGVHPEPCTSQDFIPPAIVSDNCSGFTTSIFTPVGEVIYLNGIDGSEGGFVPPPGLQPGFHTITYQAVDECGKSSELQILATVEDQIPPWVICDQSTSVNIGSDGTASVSAATFDDGTFDNCCLDYFAVKKLTDDCDIPGNTEFGPYITFCCAEAGETIQVQFRAYDCSGHYNDCVVQVNVSDEIPPFTFFCPSNQAVDCDFYSENLDAALNLGDYSVLDQFGTPIFQDNCSFTDEQTVTTAIDQCGNGTITRSWTAFDASGNGPANCVQTISVSHVSDWVVAFPEDLTITCEDDLPDFGEPEVFFGTCELMATTYDDQVFTIVQDACYKIVREWVVINWCVIGANNDQETIENSELELGVDLDGDGDMDARTFQDSRTLTGIFDTDPDVDPNDGYITYDQIIKVIDEVAPEITCPANQSICIEENTCSTSVSLLQPEATDCSENVTIGSSSPWGLGFGPFADIVPGNYTVIYSAFDNCGNSSSCNTTITVEDCKAPTPYCVNGLVIELMNTEPPMIEIWANDFDFNSLDNCSNNLTFSLSADITNQSITFGCDEIGQQAIELWVTDDAGNQDFCITFVEIQDNFGWCNPSPSVAGLISTEEEEGVANVSVKISGDLFAPVLTDENGMFEFSNLPEGYDFTLLPEKDNDILNGLTTFDLVLISKHILNTEPFNSPYKLIAGDANKSGSVTTLDIVEFRKVILLINTVFPNDNTSWRFVDKNFEFPNPNNPWQTSFPELIGINNISNDFDAANFVAIKIGDVNSSALVDNLLGAEDRIDLEDFSFQLEDRKLKVGEEIQLNFTAKEFKDLLGYQFTLNFDKNSLEFIEHISTDLIHSEHFGFALLDEGVITASWFNELSDIQELTNNSQQQFIFSFVFKAKTEGLLSDLLDINSNYTNAEAYHKNGTLLNVMLEFHENGKVFAEDGLQLFQNQPNPFALTTTIGFSLPEASRGTLTIYDVTGKTLLTTSGNYPKGYSEITIDKKALYTSGLLYYRLETANDAAIRKMLVH